MWIEFSPTLLLSVDRLKLLITAWIIRKFMQLNNFETLMSNLCIFIIIIIIIIILLVYKHNTHEMKPK